MKKYVKLLLLMAIGVMSTGCISCWLRDYGQNETRTYALPGAYTKLDVSDAFEVEMRADVTEPTFNIPEQLYDKLIFSLEKGTLSIGLRSFVGVNIKTLKVELPMNSDLSSISESGASRMVVYGLNKMEKVSLSGASTLLISGASENLHIHLTGASNLDARDLLADNVDGELSGASHADVTVCNDLSVSLSGASQLIYGLITPTCNPNVVCNTSGASTVTKR